MRSSELFENILEQPGIFIGAKSVTRLKAFVDGYTTAMEEMNPDTENFNMEFGTWVSARYNITTAHSWASIVLFMGGNDENEAFDLVKKLWKAYLNDLSAP